MSLVLLLRNALECLNTTYENITSSVLVYFFFSKLKMRYRPEISDMSEFQIYQICFALAPSFFNDT